MTLLITSDYRRVTQQTDLFSLYSVSLPSLLSRWKLSYRMFNTALQWLHDGHDSVSNHQPHDRLFNRLFRRRSKKTSKLRVTGLRAGNSPGTGEFPAQMASYAENVSIWWRHHGLRLRTRKTLKTTSPLRGNPPSITSQRVNNKESVSMSRRHHGYKLLTIIIKHFYQHLYAPRHAPDTEDRWCTRFRLL